MAIEFDTTKRFIAFWFVPPSPPDVPPPGDRRADFFCGSWLNPDDTLEFQYRWHYYDNPGDPSEGERSWYGMRSVKPATAEMIAHHISTMHMMANMNEMRNGTEMDEILCYQCNGPAALAMLRDRPWWHEKPDGWDVAGK